MDDRSKARLESILQKDTPELTSQDVAFLNARRSYLNSEQVEKFRTVLKGFDNGEQVANPAETLDNQNIETNEEAPTDPYVQNSDSPGPSNPEPTPNVEQPTTEDTGSTSEVTPQYPPVGNDDHNADPDYQG